MKKSKQLVPLCFLVAILIFCFIIWQLISGPISDYQTAKDTLVDSTQKHQKLEQQKAALDKKQTEEAEQLNSIKPVIQEPEESDGESLSVFGGMFDKVIAISRENGLLLRSIEYEMNPLDDAIAQDFSDVYNVCELKFFFVGTYSQLRSFLNNMVNNFEYLVSISKMNVTAFSDNTDYILINMSVTLYSKKPNQMQ